MRFTIYEGDYQEVKVKNEMPWIPGEFVLQMVKYTAKVIGQNLWYGVLGDGRVIEVTPKKRHRMRKVGDLCRFHYNLSSAINDYIRTDGKNRKQIKEVVDNRKRTIWEKEERNNTKWSIR
ncbi:hypothetical protein PP175_29610 (plasmid) [Aneurinibacillus sp. Ricciae_BoGa-3]|uniref:hypothetical protein n=1 Tax=Aneurinibacillus sp. Ricciae_BoGa-3 TaxID=3022697 RepID=UPI00234036B9|nr:hypothetical protein [Aneurinibacillus sp. Ricciae_BoGa-3]WCK57350.1 hypothetical protein PP175_29610 [Aneurinibacillus sp. Ricciae_BoGa-3]